LGKISDDPRQRPKKQLHQRAFTFEMAPTADMRRKVLDHA
jgi:hypothetical protein